MLCLHCELRPQDSPALLCCSCKQIKGVPRLYLRRRGWTPEREKRLRFLTARASLGLPLFQGDLP